MAARRLLVTSPWALVERRATVRRTGDGSLAVVENAFALGEGPLAAVRGALEAGASVHYVGLCEPRDRRLLERELTEWGADVELLEAPEASLEETRFLDEDGGTLFAVRDARPPDPASVDLLLDRIEERLLDGFDLVVVAGDVEGRRPVDFAERTVGRAWGLGTRTMLTLPGPSFVQALHTQPFGAFCEEADLGDALPGEPGFADLDFAGRLSRIFEDPVRVLVVRRTDGTLLAAVRGADRPLGPLGSADPRRLMGALAALAEREDAGLLDAAQEAYARTVGGLPGRRRSAERSTTDDCAAGMG